MFDSVCCPNCGLKLVENAVRGLCPGCLFKRALETHGSMAEGDGSFIGFDDVAPALEELEVKFPELEITRFIGRGGMGMVFQARQKQLNRMVALKILSPKLASNPEFSERFAREARMMALLTHPHIVMVYEFGTTSPTSDHDSPCYYLLMEYVDGLTLRQLLDARQLTPTHALAIVPQVCEALQYAHDKGVVHRDIKPENILMDRQGNVKIADFGIAKLMGLQGHDLTISTTGQVLGTLNYMAPEQRERPFEVDHRADIYSLGVVFYQMLTGELPMGRFAPPSQKVSVDVRLDEVVLRALEKEPDRRYQQASALQSQIETIAQFPADAASDQPQSSVSLFWLSSVRKRISQQSPWMITSLAICGLLVCVLLLFPLWYRMAQGTTPLALAENPSALRTATTPQAIRAGLAKPLHPWAWHELERRNLTLEDGVAIMEGLIDWLGREYPDGMNQPLFWVDGFLNKLDQRGLIPDEKKFRFIQRLTGKLRGDRVHRLRENTRQLVLNIEWRRTWDLNLLNTQVVNELKKIEIDGQPIPFQNENYHYLSNQNALSRPFDLPPLSPGKYAIHLEVLTAIALTKDLSGTNYHEIQSIAWLPVKKQWLRTMDLELIIYPQNAEVVSKSEDPALKPDSRSLQVEPIIIRRTPTGAQAVVEIQRNEKFLSVPISVDVSLRIEGRLISCGKFWVVSRRDERSGTTSLGGYYNPLTVDLGEIKENTKVADVILTPNPKWIELVSEVDRIWGKEIVFSNVPLRRLDLPDSNSSQELSD